MTTIEATSNVVLACTDGGPDGNRALDFAVEEAQRGGSGVLVLHAPRDVVAAAPFVPLYPFPAFHEVAVQILDEAVEHCVRELDPERVDGVVSRTPRVESILAEAQRARCVVLGTRQWKAYRAFGGSTSMAVASRAACPVIAVPPSWEAGASHGRVVVGVDEYAGPAEVLEEAFEAARQRGAELVIMHAWQPWSAYEAVTSQLEAAEWEKSTRRSLAEATAGIRSDNPDVKTTLEVRFQRPVDALVAAAGDADLLVIGRHATWPPFSHALGSVAHGLLRAGTCPVEIVPVSAQEPAIR